MFNGLISILITFSVAIIYGEIRKWFIQRKLQYFSSPKQYPIIGIANRFIGKSNEEIIDTIFSVYDEVDKTPIALWFGPILTVCLAEPHDMQTVLTHDHCLDKPYVYKLIKCPTSIITTNKEIWKPNRRALNTAFNIRMLQSYIPLINEKSRILVNKFEPSLKECDDLYRIIFIGIMEMIFRTTMDNEMNLQHSERGLSLYKCIKMLMSSIQYRLTQIWLKWDFVYSLTKTYRDEKSSFQEGTNVLEEMYSKRIDFLKKSHADGIDHLKIVEENNSTNLIDRCLILERDGDFSYENVMDQLRVIIVAGVDTSSITIFTTLLLLAIHQKHQEIVVTELKSIFETVDSEVTTADLTKLHYLERVIKESLRIFPPAPFIARKSSADIELRDGTIPKNTAIFLNMMRLHRDPKIWGSNVNEFDPDRFLKENIEKRPPFSYLPFSGGARNCIGMKYAMMQAKIVLSYLLRRYKFNSDLKMNEIRLKIHLVLEIINHKPMKIEERHF